MVTFTSAGALRRYRYYFNNIVMLIASVRLVRLYHTSMKLMNVCNGFVMGI